MVNRVMSVSERRYLKKKFHLHLNPEPVNAYIECLSCGLKNNLASTFERY